MKYLVLNYKTYAESTGAEAVKLTQIVSKLKPVDDTKIIVCPQTVDLDELKEQFPELNFWTQHVDQFDPGKHTGSDIIPSLQAAGAIGALLNHSEKQLADDVLKETISRAKKYNFFTCVCADNLERAKTIGAWNPNMISFEPPELISTDSSLIDSDVTSAIEFAELMRPYEIPILLGAGVRDENDVTAALEIGYCGVLLSSGFIKSQNPEQFLTQMLSAFE